MDLRSKRAPRRRSSMHRRPTIPKPSSPRHSICAPPPQEPSSNNMALLYLISTWPADIWTQCMGQQAPDIDIRVWPDKMGRLEDIDYAVAWLPPANVLKSLPHLKVIFSLGAGVDAILKDPTLPEGVPVARVNAPDLTMRMSEYVVLHVLMHHRQQRRLDHNQHEKVWDS